MKSQKSYLLCFEHKMRKVELPKLGKLPEDVKLKWRKGHVVGLIVNEIQLNRWVRKLEFLKNLKSVVKIILKGIVEND